MATPLEFVTASNPMLKAIAEVLSQLANTKTGNNITSIPDIFSNHDIIKKNCKWKSCGEFANMLNELADNVSKIPDNFPPLPTGPAPALDSTPAPVPGSPEAFRIDEKQCEMAKAIVEDSYKFFLNIPRTELNPDDSNARKKTIADSLKIDPKLITDISRKKSGLAAATPTTGRNVDMWKFIIEPASFEEKVRIQKAAKSEWKPSIKLPKYLHTFAGNLRNKYKNSVVTGVNEHLLFKPNRYGTHLIVLHRNSGISGSDNKFVHLETIQIPVPSKLLHGRAQEECFSKYISVEAFWDCIPPSFNR